MRGRGSNHLVVVSLLQRMEFLVLNEVCSLGLPILVLASTEHFTGCSVTSLSYKYPRVAVGKGASAASSPCPFLSEQD